MQEKTVYTKDSNNNTIYFLSQTNVNNYQESNYTITYNEHKFITTFITKTKRVSSGSVSESYTKREDVDIQCY